MYKIELRRLAQRSLDKLPSRDFGAVLSTVKELGDFPRPRGVEKLKVRACGACGRKITESFTVSMIRKNSWLSFASDTAGKYTGHFDTF